MLDKAFSVFLPYAEIMYLWVLVLWNIYWVLGSLYLLCNIQDKDLYIKYLDTRMISVGCIFIYFILSDKSSYHLFQLCPVIELQTNCTHKNLLRSDCFGDTIKMRLLLSWRSPDIHTQCRCTGGKFMRANIRIWKCFLPQWHIHDKRISTEALTDIVKYLHCNCSQNITVTS